MEIAELLERRKEQQLQLKIVEEDLRARALEMQRAKNEIETMQKQQLQQRAQTGSSPRLSPKDYRSLSQEQKAELKAQRGLAGANEAGETTDHPILGPVVTDLGYKRVHLVPSGKLGTIGIWKKQRTYRNDRARSMAADKEKTIHLGFPGIICLHEDKDGKLSVLDGQHRIGMMQALREKRNKGLLEKAGDSGINNDDDETLFGSVLVEVYPQPDDIADADVHAEQVFLEINKAEPIKMLDMPGVASDSDRAIITDAVMTLQVQYKEMFSTSQRCRVPNVNVDNLRNAIYGANVLNRNKLTTSGKLIEWLIVQNASLGSKYETTAERRAFISQKAWEKASGNGFYLGLDSSWLYQ
jgi:hypothetical protein